MATKKQRKEIAEVTRWAVSFRDICEKLRQGAETPGCDIRLDHQECLDLIKALRAMSSNPRAGEEET